ncbi:GNAT family N-acetyltransferase [Herbiconiux sp. UC225_62]|uniref:GNAT family N-acetyltransferase n=1 Tax=Herbiconiux sp. UC225_62 TaxID=3350168 RepID=UPI0036D25ADB
MVRIPWAPEYPVETERLDLRPHRMADLDDLHRYHSDPEVVRYIPWPVRTLDETRAALESRTHQGVVFEPGQWLVLAMQVRDTGRVIGEVLLKYDSETDARGELGYAMAADVAGRGYATEAARAVLGLAFDDFGLHRVIARLDARNEASARLLHRLGMRQEAHFRQDEWFKEEWTDTLVFAMLAEEWRA